MNFESPASDLHVRNILMKNLKQAVMYVGSDQRMLQMVSSYVHYV